MTKQIMLLFHRIYSDILSCDATGGQDDDDDASIMVMLIMLMPFTIMMTMMMMLIRFEFYRLVTIGLAYMGANVAKDGTGLFTDTLQYDINDGNYGDDPDDCRGI